MPRPPRPSTVFPDDKLERQHARILQRVDHDGRPGRLVAFPAYQPSTTFPQPVAAARPLGGRCRRRRVRCRRADGPVDHTFTESLRDGAGLRHRQRIRPGAAAPVPTTFSEEEFLGQIEVAASRNGPRPAAAGRDDTARLGREIPGADRTGRSVANADLDPPCRP